MTSFRPLRPSQHPPTKPHKPLPAVTMWVLALIMTGGVATMLPAMHATAQDDQTVQEATPSEMLMMQVEALLQDLADLRRKVASAEMNAAQSKRELAELQQFIADHDEYGRDFAEYQAIKSRLDREAREEERLKRRAEYAARKAERQRKYQEARAKAMASRSDDNVYRRNGFTSIGLDVFTSKMAFHYKAVDNSRSVLEYDPGIGHYPRVYPGGSDIDFTSMTISGSVVNAAEQTRNLGVALVFFDEHGNQVGHEVVQIANARPNVPYPFTSTIDMALNRPFSSSSTYVLYADVVQPGAAAPAADPEEEPATDAPVRGGDGGNGG